MEKTFPLIIVGQILEKLVVIQDGRQEDLLILDVSGDPVVNS